MVAVEAEVDDLRELVDGQESWSHRRRLHALEDDHRAAELVRQALDELRKVRRGKWAIVREWTAVVIAAAAVVVAVWGHVHATPPRVIHVDVHHHGGR